MTYARRLATGALALPLVLLPAAVARADSLPGPSLPASHHAEFRVGAPEVPEASPEFAPAPRPELADTGLPAALPAFALLAALALLAGACVTVATRRRG
ncbi:hypothetical protein RM780_00285 [Streptomyces sp. DSM 44917]|uniref:Gram-positive cocci surface proteins LPxTG domain-containing protein n=1 Tax=Streptomyces boetiae TaxID=3075541 RepID=A0ABU2L1G2_9ACTN|nr:hypothetical protein [Streptomyces sp. DSM 44917]MDT0305404.1 hypothetical protein [Streptomyces sp. DSM 44917]